MCVLVCDMCSLVLCVVLRLPLYVLAHVTYSLSCVSLYVYAMYNVMRVLLREAPRVLMSLMMYVAWLPSHVLV